MNRAVNGNTKLPPSVEKGKDWQMEILMEKLRSKAAQYKNFGEISKNVRMTMLDKRYALDSVEKSQHQKCLDTLQNSIKVTSLQSMIERLESLTRQLGLKFMVGPSGVELFISSDMFYLEIVLNQDGKVEDVKVHHEGKVEQQSCKELVNCLSIGDFQDFTAQLEGFASIYQLNAEKKIKSKAFTALQSLESDLAALAQLQFIMKEPFNLIYKSPVGILEERKGGHPMRLTYFISPYDLINVDTMEVEPIGIEQITAKNLGYSVTVCIEGAKAHKLQTTTLMTVTRSSNGKSTPSFPPLSGQNSSVIPASFVLKLSKPMPMCVTLVKQIQEITEMECADLSTAQPILGLIVHQASDGKLAPEDSRGLFVTLPDQTHCFFMTENKSMEAILVQSIPFTHPAKVSKILVLLRQQALFNTIIASCVRPNAKQDFTNMIMLEVTALSWTHISISIEHPIEESIATAEIDLSEISKLVCKIHTPGTPPPQNTPDLSSELGTKILNKTFSLPVTMRAVLKLWERQILSRRNHYTLNGHENFSLPLDSLDPGGAKGPPGGMSEFGGVVDLNIKKCEPSTSANPGNVTQHLFLSENMMQNANFPEFPSSTDLSSLELTSLLSDDKNAKKSKRGRDDLKFKRKTGDETQADIIFETSNDSTSRSTLNSQDSNILTPNSGLGFQSDIELSTLDPNELLNSDKNPEFDGLDEFADMLSDKKKTDFMLELADKSLMPPSVSITPITTASSIFNLTEKRGIEIIPIDNLPTTSITITPIPAIKSEERSTKDKKSKSKSDDKARLEKKRKRKRDESPMGPPEKLPPNKLDPSITNKINSPPTSPSIKYSASPTHKALSLSGKLSPNLLKQKSSSHHSPKGSPAHLPSSSPKHIMSPKNPSSSPKHNASSSSGKPSMSTLKSAANSPSSKSSEKKKDKERDKDKKSLSGSSSSNKSKTTLKLKPLEMPSDPTAIPDDLLSPTALELKNAQCLASKNQRKSTLSAIVDKLKSAQHCDISELANLKASATKDRSIPKTPSSAEKSVKISSNSDLVKQNSSEYMVKPSSDGIKLTINKTRTKDSSKISTSIKNSSTTSSSSSKVHTGLKPGVTSGPASKKPQVAPKTSSTISSNLNHVFNNAKQISGSNKQVVKSNSSSSSSGSKFSSKLSSPKLSSTSATDLRKDRPKISKSSSEKSIFASKDRAKNSPTPDSDPTAPYKYMEGLMKQLDKNSKFQIPKLSARLTINPDDKKPKETSIIPTNANRTSVESKIYDLMTGKTDSTKYPLVIPTNNILESMEAKIRNNISKPEPKNDVLNTNSNEPLSLTTPKIDLSLSSNKFVAPAAPKTVDKSDITAAGSATSLKKDCDLVLDFSSTNKDSVKLSQNFPQSPSVSVHIVKSPAPSPHIINPSPHSASPCITDDELMDEALIGMGK